MVDLATFTITVYNVSEYSPIEEEGFGSRLRRSASDSLRSALAVLQNLIIALVYVLPYLVVIGLIVLLIVWLSRRSRKNKPQLDFPPPPPQSQQAGIQPPPTQRQQAGSPPPPSEPVQAPKADEPDEGEKE